MTPTRDRHGDRRAETAVVAPRVLPPRSRSSCRLPKRRARGATAPPPAPSGCSPPRRSRCCTSRRGSASALLKATSRSDNVGSTALRALGTWSLWVPVVVFFVAFWLLGAIINRGRWGAWVIFGLLVGFAAYGGHILGELFQAPFWMLTASEGAELVEEQLLAPLAIAAFIIGRELTIWFGAWVAARGTRVDRAQHRGSARVRAHARGGAAARPRSRWPAPGARRRTRPPVVALASRDGRVHRAADLRARHGEPRCSGRTSSRRRGSGRFPGIVATVLATAAFALRAVARRCGARHPSFWGALWTTAATASSRMSSACGSARSRPAPTSPSRPLSPGGSRRRGSAASSPARALVAAWGGIALVRTRAQRPRWPWEDEFDE